MADNEQDLHPPGRADGSLEVQDYLGYRIELRCVESGHVKRESFLVRVLAASSGFLQDELWEWAVYRSGEKLGSDIGFSREAALEGSRMFVDADVSAREG